MVEDALCDKDVDQHVRSLKTLPAAFRPCQTLRRFWICLGSVYDQHGGSRRSRTGRCRSRDHAQKYGIEVLIFERRTVGGLLNNAWRVENFPPLEPCTGEELCRKLEDRLNVNDIAIIPEEVTAVRDRIIVTRRPVHGRLHFSSHRNRAEEASLARDLLKGGLRIQGYPPGTEVVAIYGAGDMAFDGAVRASLRGSRTCFSPEARH